MKQKNKSLLHRIIRDMLMGLGMMALCGFITVTFVFTRSLWGPFAEQLVSVLPYAALIIIVGVVMVLIIGGAFFDLFEDNAHSSTAKREETIEIDTHHDSVLPNYQLTDDGEIVEVVDDEKPKRGDISS